MEEELLECASSLKLRWEERAVKAGERWECCWKVISSSRNEIIDRDGREPPRDSTLHAIVATPSLVGVTAQHRLASKSTEPRH